jgi:hypothetical protein
MSKYHDHRDDCPFKFATLDVCDCVEKNMLDRIEALTAELAKAVEALREIAGECGCSTARAIIAEIEGTDAP